MRLSRDDVTSSRLPQPVTPSKVMVNDYVLFLLTMVFIIRQAKKFIFGAQKCLLCVGHVWFRLICIRHGDLRKTKTENPHVQFNALYLLSKHDKQSH